MQPTKTPLVVAAIVAFVAAAPAGCDNLLGGGYAIEGTSTDGGPSTVNGPQSVVEGGQDGGIVDGCLESPANKQQFESACTNGTCQPFPNATRNPLCDGGGTVCPAATPVSQPADAGPPDTGSTVDSGSAEDSGGDDAGDDAAVVDAGVPDTGPPPLPAARR